MNGFYMMLIVSFSLIGMEVASKQKVLIPEKQEAKKRVRKRKAESKEDSTQIRLAGISSVKDLVDLVDQLYAKKEAKWEKELESFKKEMAAKNNLMAQLVTSFGTIVTALKDLDTKQNAQIDAILSFNKHLKAIDEQLLQLHLDVQSHRHKTKKEIDDFTKFAIDTTIKSVDPLIKLVLAGQTINTQGEQEDRAKYRQEIIRHVTDFKSSIASLAEGLRRIRSQTAPAISAEDFFNSLPSLEPNPEELLAEFQL